MLKKHTQSILKRVLFIERKQYCSLNTTCLTRKSLRLHRKHENNGMLCFGLVQHRTCVTQTEASIQQAPINKFNRNLVEDVQYIRNGHSEEVHLALCSQPSQNKVKCILTGFWTDTVVKPGDIINILDVDKDDTGCYHVTDKQGLVVVNPDALVSGTTVVNSLNCMRRSTLNEKFKGMDTGNIYMLYGSIIHAFFQHVVQNKIQEKAALLDVAKQIMKQHKFLHEMYSQNVTEESVMEEINKYIPPLLKWSEKYLSSQGYTFGAGLTDNETKITDVIDIEENIWSPRLGIKGKIDLTVDVKIHKDNKKSRKIMPLELKTGKASYSVEHKGQVTLYSLMLGESRVDPESGLLLYLKQGEMKTLPATHKEIRGLINLRNELTSYLNQSIEQVTTESGTEYKFGQVPKPINNPRFCERCPQLLSCTLYQKAIEQWQPALQHCMSIIQPRVLSHLGQEHLDYFSHWCKLLELEGQTSKMKTKTKNTWCKSAVEREKDHECFSGMQLVHTEPADETVDSGYYYNTFQRWENYESQVPLCDVGLVKSDSIIVSNENTGQIAITMGSITDVSPTSVTLLLDRNLAANPDYKTYVYRLDKNDSFSTTSIYYTNLARLMMNETTSSRLRELIVERRKPLFELTLSKGAIEKVKAIFKPLNKPQKTAIIKALMCKDYVLIKGYPGSGKTSTIVSLVQILHLLGYSVLLTSYTHSAVDNILLKLKQHNLDFLRLGKTEKIHPEIKHFSASHQTKDITTVEELKEFYKSKQIVATTCLGTNHVLFNHRSFDVCIVDEASQVLQPACLGPLSYASRFVLVGDHKQLPPVVQSKDAREMGMDESLFARLDTCGATYELNLQYRMNSAIMRLSNGLVYDMALKCGSQAVADALLHLPQQEILNNKQHWMQYALGTQPVVFLDTDKVPGTEVCDCQGVKNVIEAKLVCELTKTLLEAGLTSNNIGVITPYRNQVQLIRDQLKNSLSASQQVVLDTVEVNTVDTYQGRDKHVIIMSFVRSKDGHEAKEGEILQDWRRLNVAITRARVKLIMVGSITTLTKYSPFQKFVSLLDSKEIYQLPEMDQLCQ